LKILGNCKKENTITFFGNINIFPSETLNIIEHVNLTAIQEFSFCIWCSKNNFDLTFTNRERCQFLSICWNIY